MLESELQEILRLDNDGLSMKEISDLMGKSYSTIYRFLNKTTYKDWWEQNENLMGGTLKTHHDNIPTLKRKRYIISSAQNNSYVHRQFLMALEVMAAEIDAEILISTFTYNTNEFSKLSSEETWYDPLITKYIHNDPVFLAPGLMFCAELNILPTAVNPLSGFDGYTKSNSGIIPHAKMRLESLPVFKGEEPRFLYTTGSVTKKNYVQKKAGQKAAFHHIIGALVVEVDDDGTWFVRQLISDDDGYFYDLNKQYGPVSINENTTVEGINYGDIHAEKIDLEAAKASFGIDNNSMAKVLKPKYHIINDIIDFSSRNHHNINDPYFRFKSFVDGQESVEQDIYRVIATLRTISKHSGDLVVVESNHDLALRRWLATSDYKTDPVNALFFLECQYATYSAIKSGVPFSILEYAIKSRAPELENVRFLKTDESFKLCGPSGIEVGAHGDKGINGARGSALGFAKLGTRCNIGHSHSAKIVDGVYQAGTLSKMDMGYNKGSTTWSQSNIVTYPNSKRAIITIKNGKWRAEN